MSLLRQTGLVVALLILLTGTLRASAGTSGDLVMTVIGGTQGAVEKLDGTVIRRFPLPDVTNEVEPASDGSAVSYHNDGLDGVWFIDSAGKATEVDRSSDDVDAAISPDGSKIAFVRYDPRHGTSDLYTINSDGSHLALVASGHKVDLLESPEFSPDGRTLAYSCWSVWHGQPPPGGLPRKCGPLMDGTYRESGLMLMNADGSNKRMIVIGSAFGWTVEKLSWSPDGKWLALDQPEWLAGFSQIFTYSTSGSDLFKFLALNRQITHENVPCGAFLPSFSPDGTNLLYERCVDDHGNEGNFAFQINRNGTHERELPLTGFSWRFVPPPSGGSPPPTIDETKVVVPRLRGVGYETATRKLRRAHFLVGSVHRRFSARVPRNHVIATRPRGGKEFHRTFKFDVPWVNLVVSRGPRR